ncbi:putative 2OG-Fe(II) oxygenase [Sandarakinorhabdus sp. AAP62]|uniref:putative 2OG-Fe(II) oxygenase n=1 Tax=Sandarakinorhabdus sp. AAP62 TaxID=1248916 RepID=UPI00031E249E|nr:putative 2OG-Fe(II) oxygenase [Sandarakinorhabdus sp. AAP62]
MDVNALFARAERAFAAGQHASVRADLREVLRLVGEHPAVLHLAALNESRAGDAGAARVAFARALSAAPTDAQILNNFANFLKQQGDLPAALGHYDRALQAAPNLHQARLNRAILLNSMSRHEDARRDADLLMVALPGDAAVRQTSGAIHLALGAIEAAAADFDAVLAQNPQDLKALHGRARAAAIGGEEARAIGLYRAALGLAPDDGDLLIGLAEALEAAGEAEAAAPLAAAVAARPDWVEGHGALARMQAEAGAGAEFDAAWRVAIAARPADLALALGHVGCLLASAMPQQALAALDRMAPLHGNRPEFHLYSAMAAVDAGDSERAAAALAQAGALPGTELTRARLALQQGDPVQARDLLAPLVAAAPDDVVLWANLDLAWRLLGDDSHYWLSGQPGLVSTQEIEYEGDWQQLAQVLRGLHRARSHPIGQSLRGGTQTRGRLFGRPEPEIATLGRAIMAAVSRHLAALPPADARHPLLRDRHRTPHFSGSWSVRLVGEGFHVAHIHPAGRLSSACYIVLPDGLDAAGAPGWLEVGGPPAELALDLKPLHLIRPQPGRLALFPSTLFHGTRPFPAGERLTVAFDVMLR